MPSVYIQCSPVELRRTFRRQVCSPLAPETLEFRPLTHTLSPRWGEGLKRDPSPQRGEGGRSPARWKYADFLEQPAGGVHDRLGRDQGEAVMMPFRADALVTVL